MDRNVYGRTLVTRSFPYAFTRVEHLIGDFRRDMEAIKKEFAP